MAKVRVGKSASGGKAKLKNRRVVLLAGEGGYVIRCKRLGEGRREVIASDIALSPEAMLAIVQMYFHLRGELPDGLRWSGNNIVPAAGVEAPDV